MGGKKERREEGRNGRMEEERKEGTGRKREEGWEGGKKGAGRKRGGWKEGREDGRGEDGRKGRMEEDRKEGAGTKGKEGLRRVGPLITVGGVVIIHSSVRWWSRSFVRHCALIAVDGVVVVVWAFVALVVWARASVNGMVVGAAFNGMVVGAAFWFAILDRVVGGRRLRRCRRSSLCVGIGSWLRS